MDTAGPSDARRTAGAALVVTLEAFGSGPGPSLWPLPLPSGSLPEESWSGDVTLPAQVSLCTRSYNL